jgi:hypothetical protein
MKSDVMHSRVQLEDQILKNLTTEVKETVATHLAFPKTEKNSFSVVALWNIRRNRRLSGSYRRKPRIVTGFSY